MNSSSAKSWPERPDNEIVLFIRRVSLNARGYVHIMLTMCTNASSLQFFLFIEKKKSEPKGSNKLPGLFHYHTQHYCGKSLTGKDDLIDFVCGMKKLHLRWNSRRAILGTFCIIDLCHPYHGPAHLCLVCYTAVFSVIMQRSSPQTAAENRTTFLSRG